MSNTIKIGDYERVVEGNNIEVKKDKILVDGETIVTLTGDVRISFVGDLANLDCNSVIVKGNIKGDVDATSVVSHGNIGGDVDCTSLKCGNIGGDVDASNVVCGNIGGSIDANNVKIIK
jgi:hypothetical protein